MNLKVEETKFFLEKAHNQWTKQFEQTRYDYDAVLNTELSSDEVKRFAKNGTVGKDHAHKSYGKRIDKADLCYQT